MALSGEEEQLLERVRMLTRARRTGEVVDALAGELDAMLSGSRSRAFTGIAFDAYCRSLLASRGHDAEARDAIARLCERSRARLGPQPWSDLYEACLAHLAGDDETAAARYADAGRDVSVLWPSSGAARSVVPPRSRDAWLATETPLPDVRIERMASGTGAVAMFSCDSVYLRRYGPAYLRSFARYGEDMRLHVHIADALPDDVAWLREASPSTWSRTGVTTETYAGAEALAYYAFVRYLRLGEVLARYAAPVFVTDVDAVFTRAIAPDIDAVGADVALMFKHRDYHAHPWNTVRAGALVVRPTDAGRTFSDALRRVGAALFAERAGRNLWGADQSVLYSVYRGFARDPAWRFEDLSERLPGGLLHGKQF